MYTKDFKAASVAAKEKVNLLKNNFIGYFMLSMLAGAFIGFGVLLTSSIASQLQGQPYIKVVMGCSFGVAMSLIIIAGGELFSGNNFVMGAGLMKKSITIMDAIKLWIVCFLGNWVGSIIVAVIYHFSGLGNGSIEAFMITTTLRKITTPSIQLITRAILCDVLISLGVWCSVRCKTESGKLIMIFWCLFAFITTGFEHSIANMTIFTEALLNPIGQNISIIGCLHNLLVVTIGNMIGGLVFVAFPYYIATRSEE